MPKKNGVSEYALEKMNDEREALNVGGEMSRDDSEHNSVTSSVTSHHRKKKLDDDEDEEPTKEETVSSSWLGQSQERQDLLVYYARNSTMHGIPSIVGSKLYRGRHIFWIIIVCMMALFLGTVIYWQMSDYYNY
ncbi:uncharacterized protein LOC101849139, partial [Aplysia californica]|uniref:Uncharacterized protein LOC101849139 n=1 Tax=Aplysia californica TaxID=6500 RepID=A0ABM1A3U6_APLCA